MSPRNWTDGCSHEDRMTLNEGAWRIVDELSAEAAVLGVAESTVAGARVLDCGVAASGGLRAGLGLARVCVAGRADLALVPGEFGPSVQVQSDDPVRACLAAQYAGWK